MTEVYKYKVAGHVFELTLPKGDSLVQELGQYEPFLTDDSDGQPVFRLQVVSERPQTGEIER